MVSKDEQIEALLSHTALEMACRELKVSHMARSSYSDVFAVTRREIDDYVAKNGFPRNAFCGIDGPHGCEGIHFLQRGCEWILFWLERGVNYDEKHFPTEEEGRKALIDWLINTAGTGINFDKSSHVPE